MCAHACPRTLLTRSFDSFRTRDGAEQHDHPRDPQPYHAGPARPSHPLGRSVDVGSACPRTAVDSLLPLRDMFSSPCRPDIRGEPTCAVASPCTSTPSGIQPAPLLCSPPERAQRTPRPPRRDPSRLPGAWFRPPFALQSCAGPGIEFFYPLNERPSEPGGPIGCGDPLSGVQHMHTSRSNKDDDGGGFFFKQSYSHSACVGVRFGGGEEIQDCLAALAPPRLFAYLFPQNPLLTSPPPAILAEVLAGFALASPTLWHQGRFFGYQPVNVYPGFNW